MGSTPETGKWILEALDRYEGPLLSCALRYMKDLDRARDVVQDTFIRLCKQDRDNVEDHLAEWLFVVCRNRALEILRKEKRMQPLSEGDLAATPTREPGPAAMAVRHDDAGRVEKIIKTLPERQQELIRLKFQHGLSYKEMSRVMDITVSNVGVILHTAIKKVRRQMAQEISAPAQEGI